MSAPYAPKIFPCRVCGAPDGRDPAHARGCPRFAELRREELLALALECEAGWDAVREREEWVSADRRVRAAQA